MRLSKPRIIYLLNLYSSGKASYLEERKLLDWLAETDEDQLVEKHIRQLIDRQDKEEAFPGLDSKLLYAKILSEAKIKEKPAAIRPISLLRVAAACVIMICSAGFYFLVTRHREPATIALHQSRALKNDVLPGRNGAVLKLGNGKTILLDSVSNGVFMSQGNANIKKLNGQIIFDASKLHSDSVTYDVISTPAGRQYTVVLADGSKVWLNASSSIRFPTIFIGNERKVSITGEAYFEVAHNASTPFVVAVNEKADVVVMGTDFNVNAYDNELVPRATLLEGKIKVSCPAASSVLMPGQQASLNKDGSIHISSHVDTDEVIAWKNGMFQFESATLDAIMRQLARWYDVEIEYRGVTSKHFGGTISRNVNLSQVLKMLELTGEVKFMIEGKKIIAMPV
ncbi:MAG: FecR family protein [Chitinophagales bacterium]